MESLDAELARKTVKHYACSNCWGDLEIRPDITKPEMYFVVCQKCGDETKGYVTKYFVNRRRGESEFEKRDVNKLLIKTGIIPNPLEGMTREDIKKSLGF